MGGNHPGVRYASRIVNLGAPEVRRRYPRGVPVDPAGYPVWTLAARARRVPEEALLDLERRRLGFPLPPGYRAFLTRTNGAAPDRPGVLRGYGFVADQRFFGLGRSDEAEDLVGANRYLADRCTADRLAIGYVQGGMILVKVAGADADSVWYWDDDDPRARQDHDAAYIG